MWCPCPASASLTRPPRPEAGPGGTPTTGGRAGDTEMTEVSAIRVFLAVLKVPSKVLANGHV